MNEAEDPPCRAGTPLHLIPPLQLRQPQTRYMVLWWPALHMLQCAGMLCMPKRQLVRFVWNLKIKSSLSERGVQARSVWGSQRQAHASSEESACNYFHRPKILLHVVICLVHAC